MENNTVKQLWEALKKECVEQQDTNGIYNETRDAIKKDLSAKWKERPDYDHEQWFYIDPSMSNYVMDPSGYARQPITLNGIDYLAGLGFYIDNCETIRLGIMWKSKGLRRLSILGHIDQFPDKTITPCDSEIVENGKLIAKEVRYKVDDNGNWITAKAIDFDVTQLKKLSNGYGKNKIHTILHTNETYGISNNQDNEDIEMVFFVQSFNTPLSQFSTEYRDKTLSQSPLDEADRVFYLNDIQTTNTLMATVNVDKFDMVVHNLPIKNTESTQVINLKSIEDLISQSKNSLNLWYMLYTLIPEENKTPYPEKADVVVTDRTRLASPKKTLNPNTDLQQIKDLLMI